MPESRTASDPDSPAAAAGGPFPLSPAQERFWFLERLEPGNPAHHLASAVRLSGPLHVLALERALSEVLRRHEPMRTVFRWDGDRPAQWVLPPSRVDLCPVDLSALGPAAQEEERRRLAERIACEPFDLALGPVARFALLRLSVDEHELLAAAHHVAADGLSAVLFLRELLVLYQGLLEAATTALPAPARPFRDFAAEDRGRAADPSTQQSIAWWADALRGVPPIALPADRPRGTEWRRRGARAVLRLDRDLGGAFAAFARRAGVTPFVAGLSACAVWLHRISGAADFAIGVPVANRDRPGTESLIGFFVNSLAIRVRPDPESGFDALVAQVRSAVADALERQEAPFETIVERLNPERDPGRHPLFQVMFNFVPFVLERQEAAGLVVEPRPLPSGTLVDLTLYLRASGESLDLEAEYDRDLFETATIHRWLAHLRTLLRAAVGSPGTPIAELPLLDAAELARVAAAGEGEPLPERSVPAIEAAFDLRAAESPDAVAVSAAAGKERPLTYRDLRDASERIAAGLADRGVGPGSLVGLALGRDPVLLAALLAVMRRGAAWLPLDLRVPPDRLALLVEDGAPGLVITGPGEAPAPESGSVATVRIEHLAATAARDRAPVSSGPEDLLYLIHTSGSSGRQKGVRIPRRAAAAALETLAREVGLGPGDTFLAMTTIGFDIAVFELLGPLAAGAAVRIASDEDVADPARLAALLACPEITVAQATPSRWRMLLDAGFTPRPGLRILCGGEALDEDLAAGLSGSGDLWNVYGPTETTIWSTIARVEGAPVTLGRPIAGTRVRVADARGHPVPFGVAGELWIGGAGLALGYHRRPEIEAARFVAAESGATAGRWYRTGDRVRLRPDGSLIWVGRLDDQVKIRGHRVEPAEVEAAILGSELVLETAVAGGPAPGGGTELRAWIVPAAPAPDGRDRDEALRSWRTVWDATFREPGRSDGPGQDRRGWIDSRTGLPLPESMLLARAAEVAALVTAGGAESVLEIGCGGGLLTFALAPRVRRLVALDASEAAIQAVRVQASDLGLAHVEAQVAPAHDLSSLGDRRFDAVVLNSVVQYFPDEDYLHGALDAALARVRPGGRLVIGDVRSLPLLEAFHFWVVLAGAPGAERGDDVRAKVDRRVLGEPELLVDPAFFREWASTHQDLMLERLGPEAGGADDELRRFRYDLIFRAGGAENDRAEASERNAPIDVDGRGLDLAGIKAVIVGADRAPVVVRGVANSRTTGLEAALDALRGDTGLTARGLREIADAAALVAIDPDELLTLGARLGRPAIVTWSETGGAGAVDLTLGCPGTALSEVPRPPPASAVASALTPPARWTNRPARAAEEAALLESLRTALRRRLPEAFVPARFVVLDRLPRLPSGKIDRRRLPPPDVVKSPVIADPPREGLESQIAPIWRELLAVPAVGRSESFFSLGGHSLLATRLLARIHYRFRIEIPLRRFFDDPTVAGLAAAMAGTAGATPAPAPPEAPAGEIDSADTGSVLSPGQERLWFLHQLDPASPAYGMAAAVRLRGDLDHDALRLALDDLLRRHDALRTVVSVNGGRPRASLIPAGPFPLRMIERDGVPPGDRDRELDDVAAAEASVPFDLTTGPLARGVLLHFAGDDHGLVLALHHIAADGTSLSILARHLSMAYAERRRGGEPGQTRPPAGTWAGLARDQRRRADSDAGQRLVQEWKVRLRAAPSTLDLPGDHPRPPFQGHQGRTLRLPLPSGFDDATTSAARRLGASAFALRLAAFQVLLHRLTESADIVVGTTVSLRTRPGDEEVVGFLVNTLPLRTGLGGDPTFAEAVRRVQETLGFALGRAEVPFAHLVEALGVPRDPSRNPVFQVAFDDFEVPAAEFRLEGVSSELRPVETGSSKFDLGFRIERSGDGSELAVEWDTALFDAPTVEAWGRTWIAILEAATRDSWMPVSRIPLLDAEGRRRVLEGSAGPTVTLPFPTFVEAFESAARCQPFAPAVVGGGRTFTYEALDIAVQTAVVRIRRAGAGPGDLVAVFLPRSPELVVALLGTLRAGCAFVPVDPAAPAERTSFILDDTPPRLIITSESLAPRVAGIQARLLMADGVLASSGDPEAGAGLPPPPSPEDPAYVLHTSGSTGRPKGVLVTHLGLANYVQWAAATYRANGGAGTPLHTSVAYDLSVTSLFVPLAAGGAVILAAEDGGLEGLTTVLRPEGDLTLVKLTPSHVDGLSSVAAGGTLHGAARAWVVGGEALRYDDLRRLRAESPRSRIVNEYGPTEATVGCCAYEVGASDPDSGPVPIGRPIWNSVVRLLDVHDALVPAGVPGEICIGGAGLARGYFGQPEPTRRTFVPDPFGPPGTLLYKTGDLARLRGDGNLVFLGRQDEQVKIRGVRVEPEETRAAIRALPGVRDAAVQARPGPDGRLRLVAWVVADRAVDAPALRWLLRNQLPEAFIPAAFVEVQDLPLTAHGKLDVRALPEPPGPAAAKTESVEPPATPAEQALAAAWSEVLGARAVGRHDDFFSLGGDSILSLRLVSRFRARGFALCPRDVFLHPTLAAMAAAAVPDRLEPSAPVRPPEGTHVPLLPAQRWLLELGLPTLRHWNQALGFEVDPAVSKESVRAALEALARRHDAFRLRFHRMDGTWRSVLGADAAVLWGETDLGGTPADGRQTVIDAAAAAAQGSLDLENGPLMGAHWFDHGPGKPAGLLWFAHHLVVDGVSWRILGEDLAEALAAVRAGRTPDPAAVPVPFPAFAEHFAALAESSAFAGTVEAWSRELDGTHDPWPEAAGASGLEGDAVVVELSCDPTTTARLTGGAASAARCIPPDLLLAALALTLRDACAPGPWTIDVESHGRDGFGDDIDLSRTVGWLTAIHPFRLDAAPEADPLGVLRAVKTHRRRLPVPASFGAVCCPSPESPLAGRSLIPALAAALRGGRPQFNYLGHAPAAAALPFRLLPERLGPHRAPENPRTHLLEIDALVSGGVLRVRWTGDGRVLDRGKLADLSKRFVVHLAALLDAVEAHRPGALVPEDFPVAAIDAAGLASILAADPNPADIFPLTPTQQGMLFHGLRSPESPAYLEQVAHVFEGDLEAGVLREAYARVLAQHDLFRARIAWSGLAEPHFVIGRGLALPWSDLDWTSVPAADQPARLRDHLLADRRLGLDLGRGPLFRIALIRLAPDRHALAFTWHHVLLDGWSLPLLLREVIEAYETLRAGQILRLPAAPPFREYVAHLRRQDAGAQRDFWRARLAGFSEPTEVALRPAPAAGAPAAVDFFECETALAAEAARRIGSRCRELGVTPAVVAQCAWALALARWASSRDVVFGMTVSGRPAGAEERIGLFINTVPVRIGIPSDARAGAWLRTLQLAQAERAAHEATPLPLSQAQSDVPPGTPLFESLLVFENYPVEAALRATPGGFRLIESVGFERTSYAVTAVVVPGPPFVLRILADCARLSEDAAGRLRDLFAQALSELVEDPERNLGEIPDLGREATARLRILAAGPVPAVPPEDVVERVLDQVRRSPEGEAVIDGSSTTTYAEIDGISMDLAARLSPHLQGGAPVVALLAGRGVEAVAAMLGILRAGAAWLPVDPALPADRQRLLVRDGGAVAIVAAGERIPEFELPWIAIRCGTATRSMTSPAPASAPGRTAYVIHTSGSTGRPKAVAVRRDALSGFVAWAVEAYGLGPKDRILHFASLGFDTSVEEIWPALASGATIVVRAAEDAASVEAFAAGICRLRPTVIDLPTGFWNEVVPALRPGHLDAFATVRLLILGGEAADPRALRRWRRLFGSRIRVLNTYGPTEATVVATAADLTGDLGDPVEDPLPIGRPRADAFVWVADAAGRLLPEGVPGELLIGGGGLAIGYVGDEDLTARRFVGHPLRSGGRVYRTGDRVRWRPDGQLEFLGRLDGQVKVRGQRVEPAEIEAALARHPAVAGAAVVAEGAGATRRLVAFVRPRPGLECSAGDVLAQARRHLPAAWVPSLCALVAEIPRLAGGKIDRRRLAAAGAGQDAPSREKPVPSDARVATLCRLFEEVLEIRLVGPDDGFLSLGGHSLIALRLLARIHAETGREPPLRILLEDPTPATLAAVLDLPAADLRSRQESTAAGAGPGPDLRSEAVLPDDIRPGSGGPPAHPPRHVLLTGATGFLGAHLLAGLLEAGQEVTALVRASGAEEARRRIHDAARHFGLPGPGPATRLQAIAGAVEQPDLGLDPRAYDGLAGSLDAIVHAAAAMSFFAAYDDLRPANVQGTIAMLRLAAAGQPKSLHYVSTAGVLAAAGAARADESTDLDHPELLEGGYLQSKWVAETLVREAGRRGIRVTVHRPGLVVGHSGTGAANPDDFAHQILSACLALGLVPDLEVPFDSVPVDVAARSIVALLGRPESAGRTYHLFETAMPSSKSLLELLREAGARLEAVPPAVWRQEFLDEFRLRPDDPRSLLVPFVVAAPDRLLAPDRGRRASSAATLRELAGLGILIPAPDAAWFAKVIARVRRPL